MNEFLKMKLIFLCVLLIIDVGHGMSTARVQQNRKSVKRSPRPIMDIIYFASRNQHNGEGNIDPGTFPVPSQHHAQLLEEVQRHSDAKLVSGVLGSYTSDIQGRARGHGSGSEFPERALSIFESIASGHPSWLPKRTSAAMDLHDDGPLDLGRAKKQKQHHSQSQPLPPELLTLDDPLEGLDLGTSQLSLKSPEPDRPYPYQEHNYSLLNKGSSSPHHAYHGHGHYPASNQQYQSPSTTTTTTTTTRKPYHHQHHRPTSTTTTTTTPAPPLPNFYTGAPSLHYPKRPQNYEDFYSEGNEEFSYYQTGQTPPNPSKSPGPGYFNYQDQDLQDTLDDSYTPPPEDAYEVPPRYQFPSTPPSHPDNDETEDQYPYYKYSSTRSTTTTSRPYPTEAQSAPADQYQNIYQTPPISAAGSGSPYQQGSIPDPEDQYPSPLQKRPSTPTPDTGYGYSSPGSSYQQGSNVDPDDQYPFYTRPSSSSYQEESNAGSVNQYPNPVYQRPSTPLPDTGYQGQNNPVFPYQLNRDDQYPSPYQQGHIQGPPYPQGSQGPENQYPFYPSLPNSTPMPYPQQSNQGYINQGSTYPQDSGESQDQYPFYPTSLPNSTPFPYPQRFILNPGAQYPQQGYNNSETPHGYNPQPGFNIPLPTFPGEVSSDPGDQHPFYNNPNTSATGYSGYNNSQLVYPIPIHPIPFSGEPPLELFHPSMNNNLYYNIGRNSTAKVGYSVPPPARQYPSYTNFASISEVPEYNSQKIPYHDFDTPYNPTTPYPLAESGENLPYPTTKSPYDENTGPSDENNGPYDENTGPYDENTGPSDENNNPYEESNSPYEESIGPSDENSIPYDGGSSNSPYDTPPRNTESPYQEPYTENAGSPYLENDEDAEESPSTLNGYSATEAYEGENEDDFAAITTAIYDLQQQYASTTARYSEEVEEPYYPPPTTPSTTSTTTTTTTTKPPYRKLQHYPTRTTTTTTTTTTPRPSDPQIQPLYVSALKKALAIQKSLSQQGQGNEQQGGWNRGPVQYNGPQYSGQAMPRALEDEATDNGALIPSQGVNPFPQQYFTDVPQPQVYIPPRGPQRQFPVMYIRPENLDYYRRPQTQGQQDMVRNPAFGGMVMGGAPGFHN